MWMVTLPNDNEILADADQQGGRRKLELDQEAKGLVSIHRLVSANYLSRLHYCSTNQVAFNRDPIFPPAGAGTKVNPIEVSAAKRQCG